MYQVGQQLRLERNPIYAGSVTNAKLQESVRTISEVRILDGGRIGIQFKGSKVWYSTYENSEWIQNVNMKYRNLDFITEGK